ncbi:MAG TPA: co-chaperone GroES [Candidatus Absconditabacterales bacterium]|mgnify:CR=1 FL=1|nr:co-chaperone GroES [Candidatus Absconditabacterales bacterium]
MLKTLQANNDRVIIKPIESGEEMYGSIIVPDMGKEKPEMGEVISVGPGRQSEFGSWIEVNAKVGDIVLIPKIGSLRIDFEGQEYFITADREILATVLESQN